MPVPSSIADLSTTAASNYPAGSENRSTIDDYHRALSALVRREQAKAANVASASTVNIGAIADGSFVHITGTTSVTAFDSVSAGIERVLVFDGALTLTHNATSLILPGGASITTAANDVAVFRSEGSGNWRCVSYQKASGYALTVATADNSIQDFRLTLTTATPVTTTDVTGATTVYCTPYKGNRIALYDGTSWNIRASSEFSLALGTLTSAKPYDVFCYDNSGTPTLEFLAWTNDNARATALAYQDGVLVKSGATTRRYLGTFYTTSTTQTEDSETKRYLFNYYNRVSRPAQKTDATSSWTYNTATYRPMNNSSANAVSVLYGVAEQEVLVLALLNYSVSGATGGAFIGIGADSTSVNSATRYTGASPAAANAQGSISAEYRAIPSVGLHTFYPLEKGNGVATTTWYGNNTGGGFSGIQHTYLG